MVSQPCPAAVLPPPAAGNCSFYLRCCEMRGARSQNLRAAVIETLENRRLLSLSAFPVYDLAPSASTLSFSSSSSSTTAQKADTGGARLLAVQPMITGSNPANGAVDIP